jgi:hypothetical protein
MRSVSREASANASEGGVKQIFIEVARRGGVGGRLARWEGSFQQPGERVKQADKSDGQCDIERNVELGRHLRHIRLNSVQTVGDWLDERRKQRDPDEPIEQVSDRKPGRRGGHLRPPD